MGGGKENDEGKKREIGRGTRVGHRSDKNNHQRKFQTSSPLQLHFIVKALSTRRMGGVSEHFYNSSARPSRPQRSTSARPSDHSAPQAKPFLGGLHFGRALCSLRAIQHTRLTISVLLRGNGVKVLLGSHQEEVYFTKLSEIKASF